MRIEILGCSGGIGPGLRTTCLVVDDHVLIDAGSGVGDLSLDRMRRIDHVYLTHSHLDHVCGLAFIADNLFDLVEHPLQVHAIDATHDALRKHLFNWVIWPDFFHLPSSSRGLLVSREVRPMVTEQLPEEVRITAFPIQHTVPAVGYMLESTSGVFVFTGDTSGTPQLWSFLNGLGRLDVLMIEVAFPDNDAELGSASQHYTPSRLAQDLEGLQHRPELLLTHHKPGAEALIEQQCREVLRGWNYRHLQRGEVFAV